MQTTETQKTRRNGPLWGLASLAALGLSALLPQAAQAQASVMFTSGTYHADHLANDGTQGTSYDQLDLASRTSSLLLTPGVTTSAAINGLTFTTGPSSSNPSGQYGPILYSGSELFTLGGVTKTLDFTYQATSGSNADELEFLAGAPTVYDLGSQGTVSVALTDQTFFSTGTLNDTLAANFTLSPDASTVPEPSSVAAFAFTGIGAAGLILRARKRKPLSA